MAEIPQIRKVITERIVSKIGEKAPEAKPTASSPLGIFDSGVGGLTVLREIMKQLPGEDVIYLADTARVPYGGRPAKEIIKINYSIINYLISEGVKMIIMACGTSSAVAYPLVKDKYKIPIIELVEAGSREAVSTTKSGKIGLIATVTCVESGTYQKTIKEAKRDAKVFAQACPLFVPLIEGGFIEKEETKRVAKEYLKPLIKEKVDTLILGCTHYPFLEKILRQEMGKDVILIDPAKEAVSKASKELRRLGFLKDKTTRASYSFLVTGSPMQFKDIGSRLLGKPITAVKQIALGPPGRGKVAKRGRIK